MRRRTELSRSVRVRFSAAACILTAAVFASSCGGGGGSIVNTPGGGGGGGGGTVAVASVSVSIGSSSITVGATTTATATLRDASGNVLSGRTITWTSSNNAVATVAGGTITGVAAGSATIFATSEGQTGSVTVNVSGAVPVASVTVSLAATSIAVGQTTQATATLRDANGNVLTGRTVSWNSLQVPQATVSSTGLVTGVSAGTATITATSEGRTGQAVVTVTASASTCTLSAALAAAPTVTFPSTTGGALATTDCRLSDGTYIDYYKVVLTGQTNFQVDVTSSAFDSFLFLLDASGTVLDVDDDGGPGTNSRITRINTAGTYYIGVNSFASGMTGSYTVSVSTQVLTTACTLGSAPTITVGQTINATLASTDCVLGNSRYVDYYKLTVTSTTTVTIDQTSTTFDTFLYLLDQFGSKVTTDDDSGPAGGVGNSRITRSLTPGTYYIGASAFLSTTGGAYVISVR